MKLLSACLIAILISWIAFAGLLHFGSAQSSTTAPTLSFNCISLITSNGFGVDIVGNLYGVSGASILFSYHAVGEPAWQSIGYAETTSSNVGFGASSAGGFAIGWNPPASGYYLINATYAEMSTITNFAVTSFSNQDQTPFSVASDSTLTNLTFDSTTNKLSFGVSGPAGTTGFAQVNIPRSITSDPELVNVTVDGATINYDYESEANYFWFLTFTYNQGSHEVVMTMEFPLTTTPSSSPTASSTFSSTVVPTSAAASTPTPSSSMPPTTSPPNQTASASLQNPASIYEILIAALVILIVAFAVVMAVFMRGKRR